MLEIDQEYEALSVQHVIRPQIYVDPESICYIIYTFDMYGQPKGVAVSHANIVNFLNVATPIYRMTRNDRVYQGMSIALDSSFEEIWPAWIAGATLVAGPTETQHLGHGFAEFLLEHKYYRALLCTDSARHNRERCAFLALHHHRRRIMPS